MATQKNKSRGLYAPGNSRSRPLNDETALSDAGFAPTPNYDNLIQAAELTPVTVPVAVFAAPQSLEGELIPVGGRGGVIQIPASESYIKGPISFPTPAQMEAMSQSQLGNFINAMMSKAEWYNNPDLAPTDMYREYHEVLSLANKLYAGRSNKVHPIGSINDSDIAEMLGVAGSKYLRATGTYTLPTQAQVDQMSCAQLLTAWNDHEANASFYSSQPGPVYGQWQQIGTYIKGKLDACPSTTPLPTNAQPPFTVDISGNTNVTLPVNSVALTAVIGNPAPGDTYSFSWQQKFGPSQAQMSAQFAQTATFAGLVAGTYEFLVTVQNKAGVQIASETSVVVNQSNTPPVVQIGAVSDISMPIDTVMIDGSTSYNPDGGGLSYQWTKISGQQASIAKPSSPLTNISGLVPGAYTFRLTITNNENVSASGDVSFNVYGGQTPPASPTPSNIPVDDHSTATVTDTPPTVGVTVPIVPVLTTPIAPYSPSYGGGGGGGGSSTMPLSTKPLVNHWVRDLLIIAGVAAVAGFIMYKKSMPSVGQVNPG